MTLTETMSTHESATTQKGLEPPPARNDMLQLQNCGTRIRFTRNETIFNEGDDAEFAYKVVCGAVRLCKHTINGRRQISNFLLTGEYFGFLQFGSYSFTAEAVGDTVLMAYPRHQLEDRASAPAELGQRLVSLLSQRLIGMQDHLVMLGRQSAKGRVASFLIMLAEREGAKGGEAFDLPMSRLDIADYTGLKIETVCRVLTDLKRAKIIQTPTLQEVVINDREALQMLADGESE